MTDLEFNGAISAMDPEKRILTMIDEHGVTHPFKWSTDAQDEFFQKQKTGYGLTLKYNEETQVLKAAGFWKKPEGFNKKQWVGGGKPRNEKLIVLQSSLKAAVDLFQTCHSPDTEDYNSACKVVVDKAIEMTERLMKAGGS